MQHVKLFEQYLLESGNSIENAVPIIQADVMPTVDWLVTNIFPEIGITDLGEDAAIIGSAGKKIPSQTSGDIDIAVSADKIAAHLGVSLAEVLFALDKKLKSLGYSTRLATGFQQVSMGAPIAGNPKKGIAQVDLMLSSDIEWSKFMYHSPDFRINESKYKGASSVSSSLYLFE
jgi:hypothetical protein